MRLNFFLILLCALGCSKLDALIFNSELLKVLEAKPGDILSVKLTLTNEKEKPEEVHISQADYKYNSSGENFFENPDTLDRSNAKWIELETHTVLLDPGQSKDVSYTVRVPNNSQLNGSYSSVLLIEPKEPIATLNEDNNLTLEVKVRYAHQPVVNIGSLNRSIKLLDTQLVVDESGHQVKIDIENNGNTHLYPQPVLKFYDKSGQLVKTLQSTPQNLLPNNSVRYTIPVQDIPAGEYLGLLLLDVGNGKLFAEKLSIVL